MSVSPRKKATTKKNKIALLPYYPVDWPGGDRLCFWEKDFQEAGFDVQIFPAWTTTEIKQYFNDLQEKNFFNLYSLYLSILRRRINQIKIIKEFDVIWIQRNLIPIFPFKKPYYEKLLSRHHNNVVFDYYDADYTSNYNLVIETVKLANKVTVASHYLFDFHSKFNSNTYFLRYCIEDIDYLPRIKKLDDKLIRIGWMGSPDNAKHLLNIEKDLLKIESEFPNVLFSFVCRSLPDLHLTAVEKLSFDQPDFNYFTWLSSLDIGIVPFFGKGDRVKAKISKKCIEFMACGQITISSPNVHSDALENGKNGFIIEDHEWYETMKNVVSNFTDYQVFGERALESYRESHNKTLLLNPLINFLTKYEK